MNTEAQVVGAVSPVDATSVDATHVDIVIVGAGVVGAAAALALAGAGFSIALVERRAPERVQGALGFDTRTVALSPASRALLEPLGGWPSTGVCVYERMTVWDAEGVGELSFSGASLTPPEPALGYIVELCHLTLQLWSAVNNNAGIRVFAPASVARLSLAPRGLVLEDGRAINARVIIGADGAASAVRRLAGGRMHMRDTGQVAIATIARHELPHQATAWQRFLPSGPLAFLPLASMPMAGQNTAGDRMLADQQHSAIVWSCDIAKADALSALGDDAFARALTDAFEGRLGRVLAVDARVRVPLTQQQATRYQPSPGVVLIGDAAHVVHPLAGQGMNLGLRDVRVLTQALGRTGNVRNALGDPALLDRYETSARSVNALAIGFMAGIQRLFGAEHLLARGARNEGLRLLERLPWLKAHLAKEAMGRGLLFAP